MTVEAVVACPKPEYCNLFPSGQQVVGVSLSEVTGVKAGNNARVSRPPDRPLTTEPWRPSTTTVLKAGGDARQRGIP